MNKQKYTRRAYLTPDGPTQDLEELKKFVTHQPMKIVEGGPHLVILVPGENYIVPLSMRVEKYGYWLFQFEKIESGESDGYETQEDE